MTTTPAIRDKELAYWSKGREKTYFVSQLPGLELEELRQLLSEVTSDLASLDATDTIIREKQTAGVDLDFEWFRRVRTKRNCVRSFMALVSRELKARGRNNRIRFLEDQIKNLRGKNLRLTDALNHKSALKNYEMEKRRAFYEIVKEAIGVDAFNAAMEKAASLAAHLNPTLPPQS
jgi:hypothetical protein